MGFKGDFFSEILHVLRREAQYGEHVSQNMRLVDCDDLRDRKAITRLATGFLKLLFPDMKPTEGEFKEFCVKPAVELRQRVRDELHKLDPEYVKVTIGSSSTEASVPPCTQAQAGAHRTKGSGTDPQLHPADLAQRFVVWYRAGPDDVGNHTGAVFPRIAVGERREQAVEATQRRRSESAENGSAMHCRPVALSHWDSLDQPLIDSRLQSRVTHPHPECVAGSGFVNVAIYHLVWGIPPTRAVCQALDCVDVSEPLRTVIEAAPGRRRARADQRRANHPRPTRSRCDLHRGHRPGRWPAAHLPH